MAQHPCSSRDASSWLPRTMSRWLLNISIEGDSTPTLINLCQCLVSLTVKKVFPNVQKEPPVFPLVPIASGPQKRAWLCPLCNLPWRIYTHWWDIPRAFSRLSSPRSPSFSSQERDSSSSVVSVALRWTLSRRSKNWYAINLPSALLMWQWNIIVRIKGKQKYSSRCKCSSTCFSSHWTKILLNNSCGLTCPLFLYSSTYQQLHDTKIHRNCLYLISCTYFFLNFGLFPIN